MLSRAVGTLQTKQAKTKEIKYLLSTYPELEKLVRRGKQSSQSLLHPNNSEWWLKITRLFGVPRGESGDVVDSLVGRIAPKISRGREQLQPGDHKKSRKQKRGGDFWGNFARGAAAGTALRHLRNLRNSVDAEPALNEQGFLDYLSPAKRKQMAAAKSKSLNNERIALMAVKMLFDEFGEGGLKAVHAVKPSGGPQEPEPQEPGEEPQELLPRPRRKALPAPPPESGETIEVPPNKPDEPEGETIDTQFVTDAPSKEEIAEIRRAVQFLKEHEEIFVERMEDFYKGWNVGQRVQDIYDNAKPYHAPVIKQFAQLIRRGLSEGNPGAYRELFVDALESLKAKYEQITAPQATPAFESRLNSALGI